MSQTTILSTDWVEPTRPYSKNELAYTRERIFRNNNLSEKYVYHPKCQHVYFVKTGGVKYKQLLENPENEDVGHCSVCWKIQRTPNKYRNRAKDFVGIYCENIGNMMNGELSYYLNEVERIFYIWLYREKFE